MLSLFSRQKPEWRVGELSAAIGSAKSTVSRIAHTLESQGFLAKSKHHEGYRLGLSLWELGTQAIADLAEFPRRSLPHLDELVANINESAQAAILDELDVVYVQKIDAPRSLRPYIPLGARFPAYCTATGRALLAYQSPAIHDRVIARGLKAHTSRTITKGPEFKRALDRVRNQGYAVNKGEWRADIGGVAAPVFDATGRVVGAVGVTMPLASLPREVGNSSPVVRSVVACASELSRELGFITSSDHKRN